MLYVCDGAITLIITRKLKLVRLRKQKERAKRTCQIHYRPCNQNYLCVMSFGAGTCRLTSGNVGPGHMKRRRVEQCGAKKKSIDGHQGGPAPDLLSTRLMP